MKDKNLCEMISEDIRFIDNYAKEKNVAESVARNLYSALLTIKFQEYYKAHDAQPINILKKENDKVVGSQNYKYTLSIMSEEVKRLMNQLYINKR